MACCCRFRDEKSRPPLSSTHTTQYNTFASASFILLASSTASSNTLHPITRAISRAETLSRLTDFYSEIRPIPHADENPNRRAQFQFDFDQYENRRVEYYNRI